MNHDMNTSNNVSQNVDDVGNGVENLLLDENRGDGVATGRNGMGWGPTNQSEFFLDDFPRLGEDMMLHFEPVLVSTPEGNPEPNHQHRQNLWVSSTRTKIEIWGTRAPGSELMWGIANISGYKGWGSIQTQ